MKKYVVSLLLGAALSGCSKENKQPTGQVAATVGGQEITTSDLKLELGQAGGSFESASAQPMALNAVINRKILAQTAIERGLDKTPAGAMMLKKAHELALIQLLQQAIAGKVPKPSADEVQIYIRENPQAFNDRKLLTVDQWAVPQAKPQIVKEMEPMNTLDPILKLLDDNRLAYHRGLGSIDLLTVPRDAALKLSGMKIGDVFVTPAGSGVTVSRIRDVVNAPLSGIDAATAATNLLTQQRTAGLVERQIQDLERVGQSKVKLNSQFKLPPKSATSSPPL